MSEIERAIETLNDAKTWKSIVYGEPSLPKMINRLTTVCLLARDILTAELEREKNPLTMEDVVSEAYDRGYNLGYSDGYQDGTKGADT